MFLRISQNSQENTCAIVSFITKLPAYDFIKKETLAQVLPCEFYEISKNAFSCRAPLAPASILYFWEAAIVNTVQIKSTLLKFFNTLTTLLHLFLRFLENICGINLCYVDFQVQSLHFYKEINSPKKVFRRFQVRLLNSCSKEYLLMGASDFWFWLFVIFR